MDYFSCGKILYFVYKPTSKKTRIALPCNSMLNRHKKYNQGHWSVSFACLANSNSMRYCLTIKIEGSWKRNTCDCTFNVTLDHFSLLPILCLSPFLSVFFLLFSLYALISKILCIDCMYVYNHNFSLWKKASFYVLIETYMKYYVKMYLILVKTKWSMEN